MPTKGSDEDRPADVPLYDDGGEWEEVGCREVAKDMADKVGMFLLVAGVLTWMITLL
jgi:hypothetical protein